MGSHFKVILARGSDPYMLSPVSLVGGRGRGPDRQDSLGLHLSISEELAGR